MIAEDEVQDKTQTSTAHFVHSAGTVADSHIKEHSATIFDAPSPQMSSSECDDEIRALLDDRQGALYRKLQPQALALTHCGPRNRVLHSWKSHQH